MSVGQWANIYTLAFQAFNDLSTQHGKVKLAETKDKEKANIVMHPSDDEAFKTLVHGKGKISVQDDFVIKVEVFCRASPRKITGTYCYLSRFTNWFTPAGWKIKTMPMTGFL